ncbi:MAG: SMC family ATPase, partial [Candidatus Thermoplasmatota archaeon]|nr:SMC family ATPase [Candidatus Thermoplasmatota archaeon]
MILKTLTLVNFRKFRHELIEFPDGVTGVVGLNGVGKSTIFEAIAWVLYGSVAARTSADQIKREGTEHSDPCRVELDFVFEENKYRVVREMTGKSLTASATATIDSKVAATGAETVTSYIQKKLGMDFKSFFTSIFAKQKELNALSTMVASERRPLILRMLGVDSLDEVIKDVKSDKREKESVIEKLSQGLIDETGNDKIVLYRDQIKALKTQKDENDYLIKQAKEHIRSLEKERKGLEKQCTTTKDAYEKIKDKKDALSEKKTLFEKKENLATEIKQLKNKATERQKTIEHYKKKLRSFKDLDAS